MPQPFELSTGGKRSRSRDDEESSFNGIEKRVCAALERFENFDEIYNTSSIYLPLSTIQGHDTSLNTERFPDHDQESEASGLLDSLAASWTPEQSTDMSQTQIAPSHLNPRSPAKTLDPVLDTGPSMPAITSTSRKSRSRKASNGPAVSDYGPFSSAFADSFGAKRFRQQHRQQLATRKPVSNEDATIHIVEGNRPIYVERFYNAMIRKDRALDSGTSPARRYWVSGTHFESKLVEAYCHKLYDKLLKFTRFGFDGEAKNDLTKTGKRYKEDKGATCIERVELIVEGLETEKTICSDVMEGGHKIMMFVNAPRAYAFRKFDNRVANAKKGERLESERKARHRQDMNARKTSATAMPSSPSGVQTSAYGCQAAEMLPYHGGGPMHTPQHCQSQKENYMTPSTHRAISSPNTYDHNTANLKKHHPNWQRNERGALPPGLRLPTSSGPKSILQNMSRKTSSPHSFGNLFNTILSPKVPSQAQHPRTFVDTSTQLFDDVYATIGNSQYDGGVDPMLQGDTENSSNYTGYRSESYGGNVPQVDEYYP